MDGSRASSGKGCLAIEACAYFFYRQPKAAVSHLLFDPIEGGSLWRMLRESRLTN